MNNGKAIILDNLGKYTVTIPSKKNWFILLFGTVWMGGWYMGFKSAAFDIGLGNGGGIDAFLLFWLLGWSIGGVFIIGLLLWGYFGKEKLEFDRELVRLEKTVFGIGIKRKLKRQEVKNFRFEKVNDGFFGANRWAIWGVGPGKVKFDYGLKTYSIGLAVDDAEANYLVELLNKR